MKIILDIVGFRKEMEYVFAMPGAHPIQVELPQLLLQCLPTEKLSEKPELMKLKRVTFYPTHEEPITQHGVKVWIYKLREELYELPV